MQQTKQLRLFFALWPDEEVRQSLALINHTLASQHSAKPMRPENFHITLAFLGNVPENSLECLVPMADAILFKRFDLKLDHLDIFPRAQIIWAGLENEPLELINLAEELHKGVLSCGIQLDTRPFKPHLTLMRKVKRLDVQPIIPVNWSVHDFCLVSSVSKPDAVEYKVLYRWS